ncbi:DUF1345 domain-containing protein [Schumannella sp. 10F1B-5-1]|uniref:DUF1345 domain-containing protein n=1 Tax=Schumannella sp. 10F1B-5-1 TaxID=2590780 RepID=UPI0011300D2C|nr:DUF1345 domain-containing protein [Schumannella sp. 10F1B-5-1]TPW70843.1 DUF1345 domain-containing protein [Schumannella sp. 10F1B-5-1]
MASGRAAANEDFRAQAEHRWPVAVGILGAIVLYLLLPSDFNVTVRVVVAALALAMFVPLLLLNPHRLNREARWSRRLSIAVSFVLLVANQAAFAQLIVELVTGSRADGPSILLAAVQVWVTNVAVFAAVYWEMDRGGPIARRRDARERLPAADFRFPQDEDHDAIDEVAKRSSKTADWMPGYLDYVYFSASNSMAFSATDTMPLSHRAKLLMLAQSFGGFVLLSLVIARSVSLIGS